MVLIDELVTHRLWKEIGVRSSQEYWAFRALGVLGTHIQPFLTCRVVPHWVRGKWKSRKDPVFWVGEQLLEVLARRMLPRVTLWARAVTWDTTRMTWPLLKHWAVTVQR